MAARPHKDAWDETLPRKLLVREVWMTDAACVGHPGNTFFFTKEEAKSHVNHARSICSSCPVAKDCLKFALDNYEQFGIWGGLTVIERRQVRTLDNVRKCEKCKFLRHFRQRSEKICESCRGINSRKLK